MQLLRVYMPRGFRDVIFTNYGDPSLRDRVHIAYGLRGFNSAYVLVLLLDRDSVGERVKPDEVIYGTNLLVDLGVSGLDVIGMVHYHGWLGGCEYLSSIDKGTLKIMPSGFVAFVASPGCLKAWYMRDGEVMEAELIEGDFIKYGSFSAGSNHYHVESLGRVLGVSELNLARALRGFEEVVREFAELVNQLNDALGVSGVRLDLGPEDARELVRELVRLAYMSEALQWASFDAAMKLGSGVGRGRVGVLSRLKGLLKR